MPARWRSTKKTVASPSALPVDRIQIVDRHKMGETAVGVVLRESAGKDAGAGGRYREQETSALDRWLKQCPGSLLDANGSVTTQPFPKTSLVGDYQESNPRPMVFRYIYRPPPLWSRDCVRWGATSRANTKATNAAGAIRMMTRPPPLENRGSPTILPTRVWATYAG